MLLIPESPKKVKPCYVGLPNAYIRALPPELEPFDNAVMVTVLARAMLDLTVTDIEAARSKGGDAINRRINALREKDYDRVNDEPVDTAVQSALFKQAHKLYEYNDDSRGHFKQDGRMANMAEREVRKRKRPATVVSEWSRRGLVKAMKLDRHGRNLARLDGALDQLVEISVLVSWKVLPNGRLQIAVDGRSLPTKRYKRIALPFPTQSKVALALYLFIHWIDLTKNKQIKWKRLCKLLGLPARRDKAKLALERAVNYINAHLKDKVDWVALAQVKKGKIETPKAIDFEWLDDGASVRFFAIDIEHVEEPPTMQTQRPLRDDEESEIDFDSPPLVTNAEWRAEKRKRREERQERDRRIMAGAEAMRQALEADFNRSMYSPMNEAEE
jgi:hypothetical protein